MIIIGLTGGIASGKNLVASVFSERGAYLIDADKIAHQVVLPGCPAWDKIVQTFGTEILDKKRNLDRTHLGEIVFHHPQKLQQLNRIVHPEVLREIKKQIGSIQAKDKNALVVISVPLLIEVGWHCWMDIVVLVTLSPEIQLQRLMKRNGFSTEEARMRISCQMDLKEKEKYADYIIDNSTSSENTRLQALNVLATIRTRVIHKQFNIHEL